MGQGCCIPIESKDLSTVERAKTNSTKGWRSLVQSVEDFERMDKVLNRWRQHDILFLQNKFLREASPASSARKQSHNPYESKYLTVDNLCNVFPGLSIKRQDVVWLSCKDYLSRFNRPGSLFNTCQFEDYNALAEIPLYFTAANLVKAFSTSGFLSCAEYFDYGTDLLADPEINDGSIDFRDFCHSLAICSYGTTKEMLVFLFLLFADQSYMLNSKGEHLLSPRGVTASVNSKNHSKLSDGEVSVDSSSDRPRNSKSKVTDLSDNRSVDTDATGSTVNSNYGRTTDLGTKKSPVAKSKAAGAVLDSVPEQSDESSSQVGNTARYQSVLSRNGLEHMLQFCAFWPLFWKEIPPEVEDNCGSDSTSVSIKRLSPSKLDSIIEKARKVGSQYIALFEDVAKQMKSHLSQEEQPTPSGRLLPSKSLGSLFPMSIKTFVTVGLTASQITRTDSLSQEPEESILSAQVLRKALQVFCLVPTPTEERIAVRHGLRKDSQSNFCHGYVLNSSWWQEWCRYSESVPVYSKHLRGMVIDVCPQKARGIGVSPKATNGPCRPEFIDNNTIADSKYCFQLRNNLAPIDDYVIVSPHLWQALWKYYGGDVEFSHKSIRTVRHPPIARQLVVTKKQSPSDSWDARLLDIDLYPFSVFAHWCTALGVSTESALERYCCCNCSCSHSMAKSCRRDDQADSMLASKLCSVDDIVKRLLDSHQIPYDDGQITSQISSDNAHKQFSYSELRVWILRYDEPITSTSQRKKKADDDGEQVASPRVDRSYLFALPYYQSRAVASTAYPKIHWELLLPAERKYPISGLHIGNLPCRIMIECRNISGHWPTTEICSDPRPKWMKNLLDTTLRKFKIGDRVFAKATDGGWYPATVLAVESNASGSNEDRYLYLVRFDRYSGSTMYTVSSGECKVVNGNVVILPSMTWPTPLLIEGHLGSHGDSSDGQLNGTRQNGVRGSVGIGEELIEMSVLGNKASKLASVLPGGSSSAKESNVSSSSNSDSDCLITIRRQNFNRIIRLVPFIDHCGYLESDILSSICQQGSSNVISSISSSSSNNTTSINGRMSGVRIGAKTEGDDTASNGKLVVSVADKKKQLNEYATICDMNGAVGIWNLGNTCYMSAAVQCVSHTPYLRMYFLSGRFRRDLNRTNVFGTAGKLTEEFSQLLAMLWMLIGDKSQGNGGNSSTANMQSNQVNTLKRVSATSNSGPNSSGSMSTTGTQKYILPRTFKRTLDKTKSQFEGNHQQDSQEFLSALLDALHEDLNKYDKKREEISELQRKSAPVNANANMNGYFINTKYVDSDSLSIAIKSESRSMATKGKDNEGLSWSPKTTNADFTDSSPIELLDAHELSSKEHRNTKDTATSGKGSAEFSVTSQGRKAWARHIARNKSVIVDMFQGQQCTEVRCKECNNSSFTFDPFMSVSLPLPKQHEVTILVVFIRKMPRLCALLSMIMEGIDHETDLPLKFKTIAKNFVLSFRKCRTQLRLCVSLPRLAEVSVLKQSVCKILQDRGNKLNDVSLASIAPENLALADCVQSAQLSDYSRFLDDSEPVAQLLDTTNSRDGFPTVLAWQIPKDVRVLTNTPTERIRRRNFTSAALRRRMNSLEDYTDDIEYNNELQTSESPLVTDICDKTVMDEDGVKQAEDSPALKPENWPSNLAGLIAGTRVDALDSKGNWFAGSVVEHWKVSSKDLILLKKAIQECEQTGQSITSIPSEVGLHIRIHFDNYSSKWDEWFSSKDFSSGRIQPIYSHTSRRSHLLNLAVYHRKLRGVTAAESKKGGPDQVIDLVGVPFLVPVEPWRSCEHLFRHIVEQAFRFAGTEEIRSFLETALQPYLQKLYNAQQCSHDSRDQTTSVVIPDGILSSVSWPLESLPFTIRLASYGNVTVAPCTTVLASQRSEMISSLSPQMQNMLKYGREHVMWEGTQFPVDNNRPVSNIMHQKLCIVIDWKPLIRPVLATVGSTRSLATIPKAGSQTTIGSDATAGAPASEDLRFTNQEYDDDESYLTIVQANKDPSGLNKSSSTGAALKPKERGVSLQECLRAYAGQEELDENTWKCDKCKKHSKATVATSLNICPDTLIIHIKRFNMTARFGEKIKTLVTFPIHGLDLKQFSTEFNSRDSPPEHDRQQESSQRFVYDLYGVTNHIGHMNGGHYTAFVKCNDKLNSRSQVSAPQRVVDRIARIFNIDPIERCELDMQGAVASSGSMFSPLSSSYCCNNEIAEDNSGWVLFDDEIVHDVPPDRLSQYVVTDSAYLLFYRRRIMSAASIVNLVS